MLAKLIALLFIPIFAQVAGPMSVVAKKKTGGGGGYDTDAEAYFAGIVANGGTISTASKGYVNTFFLAAKSHSYYSKLVIFSMIVGDQLAGALEQYQPGVGASAMTTSTFVGGDYTEATGLHGNGTTKYADTGYNPVTASMSPTSAGIWAYSTGNVSGGCFLGNSNPGSGLNGFRVTGAAGNMYVGITDDSNLANIASASNGFMGGTANGSSTIDPYFNGSSTGETTGLADSVFGNSNVWVGGQNVAGSVFQPIGGYVKFYAITTGMSAGDVTNFYNDVLAFETSLSRN